MNALAFTRSRSGADILTRRATVRLNSFDPDTRTFVGVLATETLVQRRDFIDGDYLEQLSMRDGGADLSVLRAGRAPLLDNHRATSVEDQIGVITDARISGAELVIEGRLGATERAQRVAAQIESGIAVNLSVGYRVDESRETKDALGRRIVVRTKWTPVEGSIVPIPADPQSFIRNARGTTMPEQEIVDDAATETTAVATRAASREISTDDDAPQPRMTQRQQLEAYRIAAQNGIDASFVRSQIEADRTMRDFRTAAMDELARRSNEHRQFVHHGAGMLFGDAPDNVGRAVGEALYHRMSGTSPVSNSPAREFMGRSMLEMGAAILEAHGERVSWSNRNSLAERIMTRAQLGGLHSTSDFPVLLSQSGNRVLRDAYQAASNPLKAIARRRDGPDFRPLTSVRLGEAPVLEKVNEHGEVKHGTRAEAKELFRIATFGKIFGLTRQAIINDDLNSFADANRAWGRSAAETEANELVALFAANSGNGASMDDGNPLYHTAHGNKAGSGTVIDVTNLGLARKALREMKGLDGKTPIGVTPKHLVVGPAKETEAEKVLADLAAAAVSEVNPFSGKLTLHVEPRFTGNAWRLFTDPAELAVIEIAYLNGLEGPQVDVKEGWDVLGVEFRCVLDFGCGLADWRGTYLNGGA